MVLCSIVSSNAVAGDCRNGQCYPGHYYQWHSYGSAGAVSGERKWQDDSAHVIMSHATIQACLAAINEDRARHGRVALQLDATMCLHAQRHSERMEVSYQHHSSGYMECIFCGPGTARGCVNGWIRSPQHHGIMLAGSRCGIGYSNHRGRRSWTLLVR